jgi:hypothetical protein
MKPIRPGGGIYVYRTRKPMSLIGKLRLPEWTAIPGVVIAGAAGEMLGIPWFLAAPAGLLITGRHFGYVGETTSFRDRHAQHIGNLGSGAKFEKEGKPWADLDPVCVLRLPLPRWKWLLRSVETLVMLLLWPVYNHKKNLWNPRRIPLVSARRQRYARDRRTLGISWNFRSAHVVALLFAIVLGVML